MTLHRAARPCETERRHRCLGYRRRRRCGSASLTDPAVVWRRPRLGGHVKPMLRGAAADEVHRAMLSTSFEVRASRFRTSCFPRSHRAHGLISHSPATTSGTKVTDTFERFRSIRANRFKSKQLQIPLAGITAEMPTEPCCARCRPI